jgi:multiple sugar transport system substrate-binding protein
MTQSPRRDFLKTSAGATAGAAIVGAPAVHAQATWNNQPEKGAKLRVLRWKRFVQGDEDVYMANVR